MRDQSKRIGKACLMLGILFAGVSHRSLSGQGVMQSKVSLSNGAIPVKELKVGDVMPDINFAMVNYPSTTASLSDFKGKYVILDFWATWCTSCVAKFPRLDSLQQEYSNNLQIILINSKHTKDTPEKVETFFSKHKTPDGRKLNLPSAIYDSVALQYFRHRTIPHYIWIDKFGTIVGVTSGNEITRSNIQKLLSGEKLNMRQKNDLVDYKRDMPLFTDDNGGPERNIIYRTTLTGYLDGVPQGSAKDIDKKGMMSRITSTNLSALQLFKLAYKIFHSRNRVILEVMDPGKYIERFGQDGWKYTNTYCYELICPPIPQVKFYELMQYDLKKYFGAVAIKEKRMVKCLVIEKKGNKVVDHPALSEKIDIELISAKDVKTILDLAIVLDQHLAIPVLDEASLTATLEISFPEDIKTLRQVKTELNKRGLDLNEAVREIEMIVISDTK